MSSGLFLCLQSKRHRMYILLWIQIPNPQQNKKYGIGHHSHPIANQFVGSYYFLQSILIMFLLGGVIQMEHRHRKKDTPVQASSHHLFVQMKSLMCSNLGEELEVIFSLFDSKENRPIRYLHMEIGFQCLYVRMVHIWHICAWQALRYMILYTF